MESIDVTSRELNSNFRVKVYGIDNEGNHIDKAVGFKGAIALIGQELLNKFVERAYNHCSDKEVCKLRRGLVVTLYAR